MYPRRSTVGSTLSSRTHFSHFHLETLGGVRTRPSKHSSHRTWASPSPRRVWNGLRAQVSCVGINYDQGAVVIVSYNGTAISRGPPLSSVGGSQRHRVKKSTGEPHQPRFECKPSGVLSLEQEGTGAQEGEVVERRYLLIGAGTATAAQASERIPDSFLILYPRLNSMSQASSTSDNTHIRDPKLIRIVNQ